MAATTDRLGRRWGFALGLAVGVLGTGLAVGAIVAGSFLLFLGGSVLMGTADDQLSPEEQAKTQGANDFLIGLVTATASFGSGLMFAGTGYVVIGIMGAAASLVPIGLTGWWMARKRGLAAAWP